MDLHNYLKSFSYDQKKSLVSIVYTNSDLCLTNSETYTGKLYTTGHSNLVVVNVTSELINIRGINSQTSGDN